MLVDNPILNSPFEEPTRYLAYGEGQPVLREGQCLAGYDESPYLELGSQFEP
jgi:type III restriction enzyme